MAVVSTSQYRPLAQLETQDDEGMSVRCRDIADSINNTQLLVAPRLTWVWPENASRKSSFRWMASHN